MAALTAATTTRESLGSVTLMIYTFTSVTDADTFASGLGTNIVSYWDQETSNVSTQASAGGAITNSNGNFTFYPGEDSNSWILFVLTRT